jgi:hypothetical protein
LPLFNAPRRCRIMAMVLSSALSSRLSVSSLCG